MSTLIDEFRDEHLQISDLLLKSRQEDLTTQQRKDYIFSAKKMLLAHLNKEDRLLYPPLREAAKSDESLDNLLNDYAEDMENISIDVMIFFDLYEAGDNTDENFHKDCNNIIKALTKRITKEETVLYKEYERVIAS